MIPAGGSVAVSDWRKLSKVILSHRDRNAAASPSRYLTNETQPFSSTRAISMPAAVALGTILPATFSVSGVGRHHSNMTFAFQRTCH